jgi:hypothetical protein
LIDNSLGRFTPRRSLYINFSNRSQLGDVGPDEGRDQPHAKIYRSARFARRPFLFEWLTQRDHAVARTSLSGHFAAPENTRGAWREGIR